MYSVRPEVGSASLAARLWLSLCLIFPLSLAILFSFFFLPSWVFYGLLLVFAVLLVLSANWMYALFLLLNPEDHASMEVSGEERRAERTEAHRSTK